MYSEQYHSTIRKQKPYRNSNALNPVNHEVSANY